MIHEINASAIIARIVAKSNSNEVRISINKVVEIGCKIEKKHPSVFVDTDRFAFHSFVSIGCKEISVKDTDIMIDKSNISFTKRLNRMLPSDKVCKYIDEFLGE